MKFLYLQIIFLAAVSVAALPPPVPSAGVVEREIEQEYDAKPLEIDKQVPAIQIDIPEERLEIPDGKKVLISSVRIQGNRVFSSDEIIREIQGCFNQELSLKDIYALCHFIDQYYARKGYFLARAYPPPQEVKNGVLVIEVIEGKLGNISIVGNRYYSDAFIRSYFTDLQDKPLQYDRFLRALMLLNDNRDIIAGAVFEKGEEFGYADVILRVEDARPIHLYLNGNNYGRFLTTDTRAGARLDWGNLITYGDTLSVTEVVGFPVNALYFTNASYTIPLNRKGTTLEGAYLFSKFKVEELKQLHLRGSSKIGTLKVNQALTRNRTLSIDVFSYFDYKQIQNFVLGNQVSFDKLRVLTVGTLIDHYSPWNGRDYLTIQLGAGIPDFLGGLKAVDSSCSRAGAGGRFFVLNVDYDRLQRLPWDMFLYFHGSGQWSPYKLTIPEQLYIGGDNTVRGFPFAIALGDSGYYFNCEFRFPPPFIGNKTFFRLQKKWKDVLQFDAFFDTGGVFLQSIQNTFLSGAGVGVRLYGPYSLTFSLDAGFPLNHRDLTRSAFFYIKLTGQPF